MLVGSRRVVILVILAMSLGAGTSAKSSSPVTNTSYDRAGQRVLRHEVVVKAPLLEAWNAFTTAEGLRTFAAPVVEFDLKTGGKFHSHYQLGKAVGDPGSIYNTVLSYLPLKMMAFRIGLTERFPPGPRQANTLFAVVEFQPAGSRKTKVTVSMLGWGAGPDWAEVYTFFEAGNARTLEGFEGSFVRGPVNWEARVIKAPVTK